MLRCPVCKKQLIKENKTYKCENNHCFDQAKQGYVNLLLSNKKKSKSPGDDREMIQARRDFLNQGFYSGISDEVNSIIKKLSENKDKFSIIDIGCGEGYYTNKIKEDIPESDILGLDISKEAIIFAARTYKEIEWIVASAVEVPVADKSQDAVLCMFTRLAPEENARILSDDGRLIIVSTGKNHLVELKEVVYEELKMEYFSPVEDMKPQFKHVETVNVSYKKELNSSEDIMNLFNMTPYKWRSPREGVEKLEKTEYLELTIEVNIDIFEKA